MDGCSVFYGRYIFLDFAKYLSLRYEQSLLMSLQICSPLSCLVFVVRNISKHCCSMFVTLSAYVKFFYLDFYRICFCNYKKIVIDYGDKFQVAINFMAAVFLFVAHVFLIDLNSTQCSWGEGSYVLPPFHSTKEGCFRKATSPRKCLAYKCYNLN